MTIPIIPFQREECVYPAFNKLQETREPSEEEVIASFVEDLQTVVYPPFENTKK